MLKNYFFEATRLASFRSQRRSSVIGGTKTTSTSKWPHKEVPPKRLAEAGFFFEPSPESNDNVTCFLCKKSLDGWEPGDNPVTEHYRHSQECGWAVTMWIREMGGGDRTANPHQKSMVQARTMTFGQGKWPHEDIDNLSVSKMVDAGWHFAPTKDGLDTCACAYCHLSLDGFELEDDPRHEHQRRAPDCYFFTSGHKKPARRGSRASVTSVASTRDSVDSASDAESKKKPGKGKKVPAKTKAKATKKGGQKKATKEASIEPPPEMEGNVPPLPEPPKRGRKRSSSVISKEPVIPFEDRDDTKGENPPSRRAKRRLTKTKPPKESIRDLGSDGEMSLTDAESVVVPVKPKKGRRRASKTRAPLKTNRNRYMPTDEDLDHALELDLERPLSDEDDGPREKPFIRSTKRVTRSRASLAVEQQHLEASLAPPSTTKKKSTYMDGKTPLKPFFREGDQDFSLPIKVPKHLMGEQEIEILNKGRATSSDVPPLQPPPKKSEGKTPAGKPTPAETKGKRKATNKRGKAASQSGSAEPEQPHNEMGSLMVVEGSAEKPSAVYQSPTQPSFQRTSTRISLASTVPDTPERIPEGMPLEENYKPMPEDNPADMMSDAGSIVQNDVVMLDVADADEYDEVEQDEEPLQPVEPLRVRRSPAKTVSTHASPAHEPAVGPGSVNRSFTALSIQGSEHEDAESDVNVGREEPPHPIQHEPPEVALQSAIVFLDSERKSPHKILEDVPQLCSSAAASPMRSPAEVPVQFTPKSRSIQLLTSTHPWSPADLDEVFGSSPAKSNDETAGLTREEQSMTVEEWVKWNAANAAARFNEHANRLIGVFEGKGQQARSALEGIATTG